MNRSSAKNTYLTPNRITSRLHWLLICLCLIPITGCISTAAPDTYNLDIHDDAPIPIPVRGLLPDLSLVRRVVPEVGTKTSTSLGFGWSGNVNSSVPEVSESRFGEPDEEADLSCVYAGLKEALPGIDIVPTKAFWEQVAVTDDVIKLSELFVAPQLDRLRAFQADVIVIAYQTDVDLKYEYGEVILLGGYADTDIETAATIVIDLHRKAIIHGSKISFRDQAFFWHFGPYPYGGFTLDPPDICNTVGRQAGAAIAEAMPGRAVRALVVVAGEDPYEASRMSIHQIHHEPSSPMLTDPSASP